MSRILSLGLLLTLVSLSAPHGAVADPSPSPANLPGLSDDSDLAIYMVRNESLMPSLSACLKDHGLGVCLQKEMGPPPSNPEKTNSGLDPSWADFPKKFIGIPDQEINSGHLFGSVGASFGIHRLDNDEIVSDPNKLATDQKLGTPSVWTRTLIELVPQIGYERAFGVDDYAGGIFSLHGVLRIVHRNPMDQVYNDSFKGFGRSEIKILEQLVPMYLKLPKSFEGSGMLPGEGIEIERFDEIELAAGPAATLIADPTSWYVQAGIFGSVGPVMNIVRGHFRTIMEVQTDHTIRVELEKIGEETEKLSGQLDLGVKFSPFTLMNSLVNMETSLTQTHKKIFDLSFDTTQAPAAHALKMAYLGKFTEALKLASTADTQYQGVRLLQTSNAKENTKGYDFQVFTFNKQAELTHSDIDTTVAGGDSQRSTVESSVSQRRTSRSIRDLELTFQNSNGNSLNLKYKLKSIGAKPEEISEFVDLARVLGPSAQQAQAQAFQVPGSGKKLKLDGYFYLSLDTQAFTSALKSVNGDGTELMTAWATILNLPHPEKWATMNAADQDQLASSVPHAKDHLHHLRNFVKALKKTLQTDDADKQAKVFVKSFRGEGTDLYPLAALATLSDKSHVTTLERFVVHPLLQDPSESAQAPATPFVLQFENIGSDYVFPNQLLY
jgi:hypothetical protein